MTRERITAVCVVVAAAFGVAVLLPLVAWVRFARTP